MTADLHRSRRGAEAPRLPDPTALDAEQAILGAILLRPDTLAAVAPHVDVADFGEPLHARIFDVMGGMTAAGQAVTLSTLRPFLGDDEIAEGVTVGAYLAQLAADALPPAHAPGAARVVRSVAARRRLIAAAAALDERARDVAVRDEPAVIAGDAMLELQAIAAGAAPGDASAIDIHADGVMAHVDAVRAGKATVRAATTGYADLDRAMNGYRPGELVIAAGRPGMGKTILANSTAYRCARSGVGVLALPLEIGAAQMTSRFLADIAYCGAGSPAFRDIGDRAAEMNEEQLDMVRAAHARLRELPIDMDGRSRVSVPQLAARVAQSRRAMAVRGITLGLVIVDHLDFVVASDRYKGHRTQEIGEIVLGLKDIARSQDVCVLVLSQLSREVEKRAAKERRPTLADLRNSGDLEQAADVVAFLFREEYYLTRSPEYLAGEADAINAAIDARGKLEMILAKNRSGPTPTIRLWCNPASSTIASADRGWTP